MNTIAPRPGSYQPVLSLRQRRMTRIGAVIPIFGAPLLAWIWVSATPVLQLPVPESTTAARFSFFPSGSVATPDDPRYVWSPMLFSVPSSAGFSGPLLEREVRLTSPAEVVAPPVFVRPVPPFAPAAFGETFRNLNELVQVPRPLMKPAMPDTPPVLLNTDAVRDPVYQSFWQDRPAEPVTGIDYAAFPAVTNQLPWQAVLFVCADAAGTVQRAIVESPSPYPAINVLLARMGRGLRLPAGGVESCRRLVIRHQPAPPAARPAGGG